MSARTSEVWLSESIHFHSHRNYICLPFQIDSAGPDNDICNLECFCVFQLHKQLFPTPSCLSDNCEYGCLGWARFCRILRWCWAPGDRQSSTWMLRVHHRVTGLEILPFNMCCFVLIVTTNYYFQDFLDHSHTHTHTWKMSSSNAVRHWAGAAFLSLLVLDKKKLLIYWLMWEPCS